MNVLNPQNAALQLEAIKSVDGAGSGLDADTLDGLHAGGLLQVNKSDLRSTDMLSGVKDAYSLTPDKSFRAFVLNCNGSIIHLIVMRTEAGYGVVAAYSYGSATMSLYAVNSGTWRSKVVVSFDQLGDKPIPGPEIMDQLLGGDVDEYVR